jgi:hypothetical protein
VDRVFEYLQKLQEKWRQFEQNIDNHSQTILHHAAEQFVPENGWDIEELVE